MVFCIIAKRGGASHMAREGVILDNLVRVFVSMDGRTFVRRKRLKAQLQRELIETETASPKRGPC